MDAKEQSNENMSKVETWRFIDSGYQSPAANMAIDEAILLAHSKGQVPPTIRFYRWDPACLSLGYFQKAEEEVDFSALQEQGIGFVRRPTGGRAVLHDQELTYSIVLSENYPGLPKKVNEAYRVLSEGLLYGFRNLGLQAEMVNLAENDRVSGTSDQVADQADEEATMSSAACFDAPSWYELVVEGRKIAGSAQMRQKGVVLQHGSILLELNSEQLFSLLKFPSARVKERMLRTFKEKAVAINDLLKTLGRSTVSYREVSEAFKQGMAEAFHVELQVASLSEWEVKNAEQLIAEKYGLQAWNRQR